MNEILEALSALEKFGIAGLICICFVGIIWRLFNILEKKDDRLESVIGEFREDVKQNNKSRARDAEQVTKAVDHLSTIVSLINNKQL